MSLNIPNCPECGSDIGGEVVDSFVGLTSWVLDVNECCSVECPNCGTVLNVSVYTIIDVRR